MRKVNVHEAKTHLSKLLERARAGEEIVITKRGKPYARLMPLEAAKPRLRGLLNGKLDPRFFEPVSEDELGAWES